MEKALVVVKFGGTSVATAENRVRAIGHICALLGEGKDVIAVVSAMGRLGQPYATDTLLGLVGEDTDQRTRDLAASCGEVISACVMAGELCRAGIPAAPMGAASAGIMTDGRFGCADVCALHPEKLRAALKEGKVPVVTGFQGIGPDGELTTLGRGGSDTSAVELGGYLDAECVVIYTDVPGIAVADPRLIPDVPYLESVSSDDMILLARWGAKVIHPRAVEAGRKHEIPVYVRSTFDDAVGTLVTDRSDAVGLIGIAVLKNCRDDAAGDLCWADRRMSAGGGDTTVITALTRGLDARTAKEHFPHAFVEKQADGGLVLRWTEPDEDAPLRVGELYRELLSALA